LKFNKESVLLQLQQQSFVFPSKYTTKRKGMEGIVVGMVGIEGMLGSGGKVTFGIAGIVGRLGSGGSGGLGSDG
jgi:hypothetical protein